MCNASSFIANICQFVVCVLNIIVVVVGGIVKFFVLCSFVFVLYYGTLLFTTYRMYRFFHIRFIIRFVRIINDGFESLAGTCSL